MSATENAAPSNDPWGTRRRDPRLGGPDFGRLAQAMRDLLDEFASALPPEDEVAALAERVEALRATFSAWEQPEGGSAAGGRLDLPGRANVLLPPLITERAPHDEIRGRVTFGRAFLGGWNVVHGGFLTLLFDDVLGRLTVMTGHRARTVSLRTDYRKVTRIGVEHRLEARMDRIEGRKLWATVRLIDPDGDVTAEGEGLFLTLQAHHP